MGFVKKADLLTLVSKTVEVAITRHNVWHLARAVGHRILHG